MRFFSPLFIYFVIGTCFGSFANVLVYRLPRKKSIVSPPSFCPKCECPIRIYDLIPLVSYFALKQRCRCCYAIIPARYPMIEFSCGLFFSATAFIYTFPAVLAILMLSFALFVITIVDFQVLEIPDSMVMLIIFGAAFRILVDPSSIHAAAALIGAAAGAVPLYLFNKTTLLLIKKDGFGYGDMKLMGATGLFIGWQGVLIAFFFAFKTVSLDYVYLQQCNYIKAYFNHYSATK